MPTKKIPPTPATGLVPTKYIWMDGVLVPWARATVHVLTHALHYGSGVFEGIRVYETDDGRAAIFRLKEHVARQFYSAKTLGMKLPFTQRSLTDAIVETVRKNKLKSGYVRPLSFFAYGKMGLNPTGAPISTIVACWPWGSYLGGKPIKVQTSKYIRIHPDSLVADAKVTGHYVNSILASLEMQKAKMDEALFLDYRGFVAEGPGENIFFVKNGELFTPADGAILASITRQTVETLAADIGIPVRRGNYRLTDLYSADELFFVGTAAEIQPIGQLDGKKIANGKTGVLTQHFIDAYADVVRAREPKYTKQFITIVE